MHSNIVKLKTQIRTLLLFFMAALINSGDLIEGTLPKSNLRLVEAWIEIHRDELMADWELAVNGSQIFTIDPLK